jgi:hypothetical protein
MEIALAFGRTLYAVWSIQKVAAERREVVRRTRVTLPYDRGFTDLAAWEASFA